MYKLSWLFPFLMLGFAEGDGAGGGDNKDKGDADMVSKADHDAILAENEKFKVDLEDMRMEVLTPEYLAFLNSKDDKGSSKSQDSGATDSTITDEAFSKMSNKEIFEKAKEAAKAEMKSHFDAAKNEGANAQKAQTQREIAAFRRAHGDYDTYRPIMYGLSLDPKNADLTLTELYALSKETVTRIHTEPTDAEKKKSQKSGGEKPSGSSASYDELKKLSPEEAAKEALAETKTQLGIESIPSA